MSTPARPNDTGPGTSWTSAYKTIQPASDAAAANNTGIANTTYGNSRISITKNITLRSENGPGATTQGTTATNPVTKTKYTLKRSCPLILH